MTHSNNDPISTGTPPDQAAAGDVSTTGHSSHSSANMPAGGATAHDAHADAHGGHGTDTSDVSTLVPTTWRQLVFPAIILLFVAILVSGPIFNAFASHPAAPPATQNTTTNNNSAVTVTLNQPSDSPGGANQGGTPTPSRSGQNGTASTNTAVTSSVTATVAVSTAQPTGTVAPQTTATTAGLLPSTDATRTAVALAGEQGIVSRVPVQLKFGTASFLIKAGDSLLPDWKPSPDVGIATWIDGTFANHILYLPYNDNNAALFKAARSGDNIQLTMNTGQVFNFLVTRSTRAYNGPQSDNEQFTVTTAMSQDHAGVTLFLIGDPAADRAVVQGDFTGNITQ
ncbi:MAG: hypothetical protein M3014_11500 [Chloroflexota bacterium]|nr:hypothetical protein [Chloroflexota bacterium]